MGICDLCGFHAVLVGRVKAAVSYVLHNRSGEKVGILKHRSERAPQIAFPDIADIDAVVGDGSALNVIEPVDQVCDGRLSGAGGADKGDLLPRLCVKRQSLQHRLALDIREIDVKEPDVAPQRDSPAVRLYPEPVSAVPCQRHLSPVLLGRHIKHVENPFRAGEGEHYRVELLGYLAHAVGKGAYVAEEGYKDAARIFPGQPQNADCAGKGIEEVRKVVEYRAYDRCNGGCLGR